MHRWKWCCVHHCVCVCIVCSSTVPQCYNDSKYVCIRYTILYTYNWPIYIAHNERKIIIGFDLKMDLNWENLFIWIYNLCFVFCVCDQVRAVRGLLVCRFINHFFLHIAIESDNANSIRQLTFQFLSGNPNSPSSPPNENLNILLFIRLQFNSISFIVTKRKWNR